MALSSAMRVASCIAVLAVLTGLAGCACLPGRGTAANALDALEQSPSTFDRRDEIPSKRL